MRQSIRALGWTVTISTIILFLFLVTAFYSAVQTIMTQGITISGFQTRFSDGSLILSVPITVNNTGYYDITDFTVKTILTDANGTVLVEESTVMPEVRRGETASTTHNLTMNVLQILSNMTHLLFHDSSFNMTLAIRFRYAHAFSFQVAMKNMSMPWGAPLKDLTVKNVTLTGFNGTFLYMKIALELKNNAFFDIGGILRLKVYDETGKLLGSGTGPVHVPHGGSLTEPVEAMIEIEDPLSFTGKGYVEVSLELPMMDQTFDLGRIEYE